VALSIVCLVYHASGEVCILAAKRALTMDNGHLALDDDENCEEFVWQDAFSEKQKKAIRQKFLDFVGGANLAGYGQKDLAEKVRDLSGRTLPIMDTAILARVFFPRQKHYAIEAVCRDLGIEEPAKTDAAPMAMAKAIGRILVRCWEKGFAFDASYFLRVEPSVSQTAYRGFFEALKAAVLNDTERKPNLTGLFASATAGAVDTAAMGDPTNICVSRQGRALPKDFQWPASCFAGDGLLASAFAGFESRSAQVVMTQRVVDAFDTGSHMVIEAETGTGKSLAYLLPALWWAKLMGQKVVVATHTIPLQEQLFAKELPFLARVLPFSFQAVLLKGRNNYLCPLLLEEEAGSAGEAGMTVAGAVMVSDAIGFSGQPRTKESRAKESRAKEPQAGELRVMLWPMLLSWLRETRTGDISELPQLPEWYGSWSGLCADSALCIPARCRHADQCFMLKARKAAQEADVIVINHSLLFRDMRMGLLPEYHYLIVDEAHNLYAGALQHLGFEMNYERLSRWLDKWRQSARFGKRFGRGFGGRGSSFAVWQEMAGKIKDLCSEQDYQIFTDNLRRCPSLTACIEEQAAQTFAWLRQIMGDHLSLRLTTAALPPSAYELLKVELENLSGRLEELDGALKNMQHCLEMSRPLDGLKIELARDRAQLSEWIVGLRQAAVLDDVQRVIYLEKVAGERSASLWLKSAPLDIAAILQEELFASKEAVVLCSATLSVAGDFSYFMGELGLSDETAETLTLKSHFDYQSQMLSCIVSGLPLQGDENKLAWDVAAFIVEVAQIVGGRVLVLFTSHRLLRLVNDVLEGMARQGEPVPGVLAQGIHGGRDALLEDFRTNPERVLLGASSFWEGIDLPGEELTCLIMVRLPFWPPNMPVIEARSELTRKKGQDPFSKLFLPEAVIRFKQGFGRLLRTRKDKGVFILLDDRVVTKGYGSNFLRSLPKRSHVRGNREQVLEKLSEFFERGSA